MEADQSQFEVETQYCFFLKKIWYFASFDVSLQDY